MLGWHLLTCKACIFTSSIHPSFRKFLQFALGSAHFQYTILLFGLSLSPRVFTKCMVVVAAHLCLQGVQIFQYIDWLLLAPLRDRLLHRTTRFSGFHCEHQEVVPCPLQVASVHRSSIGFCLLDGFSSSRSGCDREISGSPTSCLRDLHSIGRSISFGTYSGCHYCSLRQEIHTPTSTLVSSLVQSPEQFSKCFVPPCHVQASLLWWTHLPNLVKGVPFLPPIPSVTDYRCVPLGLGHSSGHLLQWGPWPASLSSQHINFLELLAIFWALQRFRSHLTGKVVQISDNMTVVSYLNKQGGMVSRSLCHLALVLWDFCI